MKSRAILIILVLLLALPIPAVFGGVGVFWWWTAQPGATVEGALATARAALVSDCDAQGRQAGDCRRYEVFSLHRACGGWWSVAALTPLGTAVHNVMILGNGAFDSLSGADDAMSDLDRRELETFRTSGRPVVHRVDPRLCEAQATGPAGSTPAPPFHRPEGPRR